MTCGLLFCVLFGFCAAMSKNVVSMLYLNFKNLCMSRSFFGNELVNRAFFCFFLIQFLQLGLKIFNSVGNRLFDFGNYK